MSLPDPLTPPDCDCRGLPYMPLKVAHLIDSDFAALSTGAEFKAGVLLWAKSWSQVPAASLPNNDRILASLVGLSLADWLEVREMALHNWVECADGRLYHPLVADLAIDAAKKRKGQADRANSRWAKAKAEQTERASGKAPALPRHGDGDAVASQGDAAAMQGRGRDKESPHSPPGGEQRVFDLTGEEEAAGGEVEVDEVRVAFDAWNATAAACGLAAALDLTDKRRKAIGARLKTAGLSGWREAMAAVEASRFCRGLVPSRDGRKPFRADLDFVVQITSFQRLREGYYGNDAPRPVASAAPTDAANWAGPAAIWDMAVDEKDEAWARSWLRRCTWQDIPKSIVSENGAVVDTINRELGHILRRWGVAVIEKKAA